VARRVQGEGAGMSEQLFSMSFGFLEYPRFVLLTVQFLTRLSGGARYE
jgi:hypothetical protein